MEILVKNKKGANPFIFWGILIGVIIIIIVVAVIIITNQNPTKKEKILYGEQNMNLYLLSRDSQYKSSVEGKYYVFNQTHYLQGVILKDSLTEINNVSNNVSLEIMCSGEGFYTTKIEKRFTEQEKGFNSSKINCYLDKIGEIVVSTNDKLENGEETINLNLLAKGYYKNIKLCVSWTSGIISVKSEMEEIEKPEIYKTIVDNCYYVNQSLKDDYVEIPFLVKSENLNSLDAIAFYVMDSDNYFQDGFKFGSYNGNKNIGNPEDEIFVLRYEG